MRSAVRFFAGLLWALAQDLWADMNDRRKPSTLPPPVPDDDREDTKRIVRPESEAVCRHSVKMNRRCLKCSEEV